MNSLRSVLVHVDASPRSQARLSVARDLANSVGAQLSCLYAHPSAVMLTPWSVADGVASMLPLLEQLDHERRSAARALFDKTVPGGRGVAVDWRELGELPLIPGAIAHALCADLLVLGQHAPDDPLSAAMPPDFVQSVLIGSGKPALIVPYVGARPHAAREVLIAWKPTREAAHALSASVFLLGASQCIHLVSDPADRTGPGSVEAVTSYLRAHGVRARIEHHASLGGQEPGESLLSLCADVSADLLVMGCYGHSRARELVLGGVSRTVLKSMTLPVLMAH